MEVKKKKKPTVIITKKVKPGTYLGKVLIIFGF